MRPGLQKYCIDQFDRSYLSVLDFISSWYILLQIYYKNYFVYLLQISFHVIHPYQCLIFNPYIPFSCWLLFCCFSIYSAPLIILRSYFSSIHVCILWTNLGQSNGLSDEFSSDAGKLWSFFCPLKLCV